MYGGALGERRHLLQHSSAPLPELGWQCSIKEENEEALE